MADVPLPFYPTKHLISDEEVRVGQKVMGMTWLAAAEMCNYLNFYAKRIMPFQSWTLVNQIDSVQIVVPIDAPAYTRYIWVVIASYVYAETTYGTGSVTLTVTTNDGSAVDSVARTLTVNTPGTSSDWPADDHTTYYGLPIEVTGNSLNLVTATLAATGWTIQESIVGIGAWEVPGRKKTCISSSGLLSSPHAVIGSTTVPVVDPSDFYLTEEIDTDGDGNVTDIDAIEAAVPLAWDYNRRICFSVGAVDDGGSYYAPRWYTSTTGAWTSITTISGTDEGFYIPPYPVSKGNTMFKVQVVIRAANSSGTGTTQWRAVSAYGNSSADSIVNDTTLQWRPCWSGGAFDGSIAGLEIQVAAAGEWIDLEVYQPVGCTIYVYQVIAWVVED